MRYLSAVAIAALIGSASGQLAAQCVVQPPLLDCTDVPSSGIVVSVGFNEVRVADGTAGVTNVDPRETGIRLVQTGANGSPGLEFGSIDEVSTASFDLDGDGVSEAVVADSTGSAPLFLGFNTSDVIVANDDDSFAVAAANGDGTYTISTDPDLTFASADELREYLATQRADAEAAADSPATIAFDIDGDGTNETVTTVTDGNGEYGFVDLFPGTYTVAETVPQDSEPTTATSITVTVRSGEEIVALPGQAGIVEPADPRFEVRDLDALARELGADHTIDYRNEKLDGRITELTDGKGADVVYDTVGPAVFQNSIPLTAHYGRLVTLINPAGTDWTEARIRNLGVHFTLMLAPWVRNLREHWLRQGDILRQCGELFDSGKLQIRIQETLPLEKASEAHRIIEEGHTSGKLVLTI